MSSGWRMGASTSGMVLAALLTACLSTVPRPAAPTVDAPLAFLDDFLAEASTHPERLAQGQRRAVPFHQRAKQHLANDDLPATIEALAQAYEQLQSYETAASLGATMLVLGRFHEAASYLDEARRLLPSDAPAAHREKLERYLDGAAARAARVTIRGADADTEASLYIDGRFVGSLPIDRVIYLGEGPHRFDLELGRRKSSTVARVQRGADATVELTPLPAVRVPPPDDRPVAPIVYGTVVGAGIAAAIAGGVLVGLSAKLAGEADEIGDRSGSLACGGEAPSCDELHSIERRRRDYLSAGVPLLVAGSALTAVFATLLLTSGDRATDLHVGTGTSIHPVVASDVAGVIVEGRF